MNARWKLLVVLSAVLLLPVHASATTKCDKASLSRVKTVVSSSRDQGCRDWIRCYAPGAGFSAVYDHKAREFVAIAIQGKATLQNGEEASGRKVSQNGGHREVADELRDQTHKKDNRDFVGFWFNVIDGPALEIGWTSGTINEENFGERAAPSKYRSDIRSIVERTTGLDVR